MLRNNCSIIRFFRELCEEILLSSLGESAGGAVLFFMRMDLGKDSFDVLWEDPKAFYDTMEKVLGAGAKVVINLIVTNINVKCGLNVNPEHFIELMRSGDQSSVKEIHSILKSVANCMSGEMKDERR